MPRVPPARQRVGIAPLSTPSPVQQDQSGLRALARGVGQVADVATDQAVALREEQERARLDEAFTDLTKVRLDIESTARQQKGRDALDSDLENQTSTNLSQAADKIEQDLPPHLRPRFARARRQNDIGLLESVRMHVGKEAESYRVEQYEGVLGVAKGLGTAGAVAAPPGVPIAPEVLEARQVLLNAIQDRTRTLPPEAQALKRIEQLTDFHAGIVEALAKGGRAGDAAAYLNTAKAEMEAGRAAELSKTLAGPVLVQSANALVQGLEAKEPDPEKRLQAVLAVEGPLGEKALQVFREREAVREELQKDVNRSRFGRVTEAIEKGQVRNRSQVEALVDFQRLPDEDRPRALKYLEDNIRGERTLRAAEKAAQAQVDESLRKEFAALPVEERAKLDVKGTFAGRASKDGLNVLLADQQRAAKEFQKDRGVGGNDFKAFVLGRVSKAITSKSDQTAFLLAVDSHRQAWLEAHNGQEPPREEVRKWIANELTIGDASEGGSWLSPDRPRYKYPRGAPFYPAPDAEQSLIQKAVEPQAPAEGSPASATPTQAQAPTPAKVTGAAQIPSGERALIVDAFQRRNSGRAPSDAEVLLWYRTAHPEAR